MSPPVKPSSLLRPSATFADDNLSLVLNDSSSGNTAETEPRVLRTLSRYEEAAGSVVTAPVPRLRHNFFGGSPAFGQRLAFPLDPATLHYNPNGTVESGTLRADTTIHGATFAKGSRIRLHEDGSLRFGFLAKKQKIQGILCGRGQLWFHPNGKLSQAKLDAAQAIQGIHCDQGNVWFHDNGRLALASLAKDQNIRGTPCLRGDVWFHRNSVLSQATLAKTQTLRGLPLSGNASLSFHENGALRSATLSADATVSDLPCQSGSVIWFHDNRRLAQATLAEDLTIRGKAFSAGDAVRFRDDGALQ